MTAGTHTAEARDATASPPTIRVWDLFVRVFHWSLVFCFAAAWITAEEWGWAHENVGYAAAGLVGLRLIWGLIGTRNARFASFIRSPGAVIAYLKAMLRGDEKRYVGHNPPGGYMILALLAGILGIGATGWMMTLDAYWGVEWVEELHELLATGVLVLVGLHVAGVLLASMRHGENLVRAMVTGRKRREA